MKNDYKPKSLKIHKDTRYPALSACRVVIYRAAGIELHAKCCVTAPAHYAISTLKNDHSLRIIKNTLLYTARYGDVFV